MLTNLDAGWLLDFRDPLQLVRGRGDRQTNEFSSQKYSLAVFFTTLLPISLIRNGEASLRLQGSAATQKKKISSAVQASATLSHNAH